MLSCEICEISKNTFSYRTPPVAASQNMKAEWRKISDNSLVGSGLAQQNEPEWHVTLNMVFAETSEETNLTSCAAEKSFVEGNSLDLSEGEAGESDSNNES